MTANIVVSLIKMAHADYVTFKMNESEFRRTIGNIQNVYVKILKSITVPVPKT